MESGIVSYGVALPRCRLAADEILKVWNNTHKVMLQKLGYEERAVLYPDQDTITLAIDAGSQAISRAGIAPESIGALILGTGTDPYQTKAGATVVAEALGLSHALISFDLQFAGKSGTSAMIVAQSLVESGMVERALAIGADTMNRHTAPGHLAEYGASAGAVAVLVGKEGVIARMRASASWAQDQADNFRVEGDRFMQVGGGMAGYVSSWGVSDNVPQAVRLLFERTGTGPGDLQACALHQNSFIVPMMIAQPLKLDVRETVLSHILTPLVGDLGAASALLPLANILDEGGPGRRILVASFGSGAGADALLLETTEALADFPNAEGSVMALIEDKIMLDYGTAQKYEHKYLRPATLISGYI